MAEFELYNLEKDVGQYENIIESHPRSEYFKQLAREKLQQIQSKGHYWQQLPPPGNRRKIKTEWVKYSR